MYYAKYSAQKRGEIRLKRLFIHQKEGKTIKLHGWEEEIKSVLYQVDGFILIGHLFSSTEFIIYVQGCKKFSTTWFSSQLNPHYNKFPPTSPFLLDILPNTLNFLGKMILLPISPFSMIFPSPLHNLIFFPSNLSTPPPKGRNKELYTSLVKSHE